MNEIPCTIIFGSPHSDGSSNKILKSFCDKIKYPLEYAVFNAYSMNVVPCTDCGFCKNVQKCAFEDMDGLYKTIESSSLLIIASPVYNMSFPSPLKAILDRFQRYYNARFSMGVRPAIERHRKAVLLATAGSMGEDGELMQKQLIQSFSVMNTELCASAVINGLDGRQPDENDEKIIRCADIINSYLSDLSN